MNSFRNVQRALEYEIKRQQYVLEGGGEVVQETRLWDDTAGVTHSMRSKEEAHDYRYFPDPGPRPGRDRRRLDRGGPQRPCPSSPWRSGSGSSGTTRSPPTTRAS